MNNPGNYWGNPQRGRGSDGQSLAIPAPGSGVYAPGTQNPITGMPYPVNTVGQVTPQALQVQLPYWTDSPLNAAALELVTTNVVNVNASSGNSTASTAATTLANAYAFNLNTVTAPTPLQAPDLTTQVALITYNAVTSGVFRKFGIQIFSAMGLRAIRVQIRVNGNNFPGFAEEEMAQFYEGNTPATICVPFQPQDTVTVLCRNLDLYSAYLVTTRLSGWRNQT